jgi:hypothetical protein
MDRIHFKPMHGVPWTWPGYWRLATSMNSNVCSATLSSASKTLAQAGQQGFTFQCFSIADWACWVRKIGLVACWVESVGADGTVPTHRRVESFDWLGSKRQTGRLT